jgi:hypothetical protein
MKYIILLAFSLTSLMMYAQKSNGTKKTTVNNKKTGAVKKAVTPKKKISVDSTLIKEMANDMCTCFKPISDSMHPLLTNFLKESIKYGEKKAEENMGKAIAELSQEEQEAFMKSADKLNGGKENSPIDQCMNSFTEKYQDRFDKNSKAEDAYMNAIVKYMVANKECEILALFIQVGLKEDKKGK